jgi:hypothetical protein
VVYFNLHRKNKQLEIAVGMYSIEGGAINHGLLFAGAPPLGAVRRKICKNPWVGVQAMV